MNRRLNILLAILLLTGGSTAVYWLWPERGGRSPEVALRQIRGPLLIVRIEPVALKPICFRGATRTIVGGLSPFPIGG